MNEPLPDQCSGSGHTLATLRHPYITDPISSKRVCFYKSGDPQFNGLRMVINNRTFKTFDALLDSLSKKVPLPFGVRNISTPRGTHAVRTLDQLEDGKSYICSDRRKVIPINLVLASKKPPPWYHARPVSARRQAVQLARHNHGRAAHKQQPAVVVRTPKRLMVFCNGDPSIRHTVMLQKKSTPTFESLLDYVSELMQFHVVKLHMADGRRVDGLPALILCSGCVVAAGREPFKSANYNAQKFTPPPWLPTNRMRPRRLKRTHRKKKSLPGFSKSRIFSPSSERYLVNQIHNSIAGSSYSNRTGSAELEMGRRLESVAETEDNPCLEDGRLPTDDDIEKSFRVNQDGSMTVEMRVRLTIKEEESIHWTTTLSRSYVANELNLADLPHPEPELEENSPPESNPLGLQDYTVSTDNTKRKHSRDDRDPPSMESGIPSEDGNEEDTVKSQTDVVSPRRAPTPGPRTFGRKQVSVESVRTVTEEDMVGSYSYREQRENGQVIEESCTVKRSCMRPVPKPRRVSSVDINNRNNLNQSTFKAAGRVAEILQIEDGSGKSTEAFVHIYEQQTHQDSFLANGHSQGVSAYGLLYGRPATSDTARFSSTNDFETELGRPSTASESGSIWRTDHKSAVPPLRTGINSVQKQPLLKPAEGKDCSGLLSETNKGNSQQRSVDKPKRMSLKPKVKYVSPRKIRKESKLSSPKIHKKGKTFSSAAFLRKIYGYKPKSVKIVNKQKQKPQKNAVGEGVDTESSELHRDSVQYVIKDPNILSPLRENKSTMVSFQNNMLDIALPGEESQPRGILRRQQSMRREREDKDPYNINEDMLLPALNSSSSVINEYVEHWLEESHSNPTAYPGGEAQKMDTATQTGTEDSMSERSDINSRVTVMVGEPGRLQAETHKPICPIFRNIPLPDSLFEHKEMQRNESFVNKPISQSPLMEKTSSIVRTTMEMLSDDQTENKQLADVCSVASSSLYKFSSDSSLASEDRPAFISPIIDQTASPADHPSEKTNIPITIQETSLSRNSSVKRARLVSNLSFERKMSLRKASLEKSALTSDTALENTSSTPMKIAVESTNLSSSRTPAPSSPSYCVSASPTSLTSEDRAFSASPSSDEAASQTHVSSCKTVITQSNLSNQKQVSSPKLPMKKNKLISNQSLERKLSIRKTSSERSESLHDRPLENTHVSSSPSVGRKPLRRNQSLKSASSPDKNPLASLATRNTVAPTSSPTTERLPSPCKNRLSPYSQSMEVVSPPMKLKSKRKSLPKNLSLDNTSEPANQALKRTSSERKDSKATPSKSKAILVDSSLDKTQKSLIETQITPQPLKPATQLDIKPVVEELCHSIKSIRQVTQSKRPSCLEKSNSLPDFSSHVASTFGSSSKALLAFLSVMTLKGATTSLTMQELNDNNVSCTEALRMIDALREIASMEDADQLKASLSDLQQSTSAQLLQSWKGFRELSDKCKSHSPSTNPSEPGLVFHACSAEDCGVEEKAIDELINELDMPDKLKEELAALPVSKITDSEDEGEMATKTEQLELSPEEKVNVNVPLPLKEEAVGLSELIHDDEDKVNVKSMTERFMKINQPKICNKSSIPPTVENERCKQHNLSDDQNKVHIERSTIEKDWGCEQGDLEELHKVKCQKNPIDHNIKQKSEKEQPQNATSLGPNGDKDIDEGTQSSRKVEDEESEDKEKDTGTQSGKVEEDQECHIEDKPSQETPDNEYMYVKVCTEESMSSLEEDKCSLDEEQLYMECKEVQVNNKESTSIYEGRVNLDDEEKVKPSANKDVEQKENSISTPGVEKQSRSERSISTPGVEKQSSSERSISTPVVEKQSSSERRISTPVMERKSSSESRISTPGVEKRSNAERSTSTPGVEKRSSLESRISTPVVEKQSSSERRISTPGVEKQSSSERRISTPVVEKQSSSERRISTPVVERKSSSESRISTPGVEKQSSLESRISTPGVEKQSSSERSISTTPEVVKQSSSERRISTPVVEKQSSSERRISTPVVERKSSSESRISTPGVEKQSNAERSTSTPGVEKRSSLERRISTPVVEKQSNSERSTSTPGVEKQSNAERSTSTPGVEKRSSLESRISTPGVEKQSSSERSISTTPEVEKQSSLERRISTPVVEKQSNAERSTSTPVVEKQSSSERSISTPGVEKQSSSESRISTPGVEKQSSSERSISTPGVEKQSSSESRISTPGVEKRSSLERSISIPEVEKQSSSEDEQLEVECNDLQRMQNEDHESHPNTEDEETNTNNSMGFNVSIDQHTSSPDVEDESSSEEEQLQQMCKEDSLSDLTSHSNSREEATNKQPSPNNCMGLDISEESASSPEVAEQSSSEGEQREVRRRELHDISEERLSNLEEDLDSLEEQQEQESHEEKMKRELQSSSEEREDYPQGDKVSLGYMEDCATNLALTKTSQKSSLIDNHNIYVRQENGSAVKQSSTLPYSFDEDEDSGNDHSSCEEQADEAEQVKVEYEQRRSVKHRFGFEEKQSSSEEERDSVEPEESDPDYQESHGKGSPMEEHRNCETVVEQPRCPSVEQKQQSVAERVILLQKRVDSAQQNNSIEGFGSRQLVQNDNPSVSDAEDQTTGRRTQHSPLSTTSVPQSSLSFSYDSSGVITKEPEGYRVRSIKEMFLAKGGTDIQCGQRQFPSQNTSALSNTPETPDSGGYQSQTSSELSGPEDDSTRTSITRGFVRRTIERLYGKKDANIEEHETQRPPSAPKPKNKESSNIFPPFHRVQSKVMSDLSYLNAANTSERYSETTQCITFNAQVGPGEKVPTDEGRWLLRENTLIRKSISDPVGINKSTDKALRREGMFEDTKEDVPYSLFSTKSECREDKVTAAKCTYFSLPHAKSEADLYHDFNTVSLTLPAEEPAVERNKQSEETKTWVERNGILPSIIPTEFKMLDNKVHPLVEGAPSDSPAVVSQPQKGHGVVRCQEPDALDMLYTFCGQHCPIL